VLKIVPSDAMIGADVTGVELSAGLDSRQVEAIRRAFDSHAVLRFRGQNLDVEGFIAFGRHFGALDRTETGAYGGRHDLDRYPELMLISNVVDAGGPVGALGDGELKWHSDMSNWQVPPWATLLYAVDVPPAGGETGFASMYGALEQLPARLRRRIAGRQALSDGTYDATGKPNHNPVSAAHPMIARHPFSGRDMLYLGRKWNGHIVDMQRTESEALLDELWRFATEPRFVWTQTWRPGDLLMWDNLATLHRRSAFDPRSRRMMWRLQVTGRPIMAAA
jgi:taurine dioxygenase